MKDIIILGKKIDASSQVFLNSEFGNLHDENVAYEISSARGGDEKHTLNSNEGDVLELFFEDGSSWFVPSEHIEEVFQKKRGRSVSSSNSFVIPSGLYVPEGKRGLKEIGLKFVRFFSKKAVKKYTTTYRRELGQNYDQKRMPNPGLFRIDENFELKDFKNKVTKNKVVNKKHLLFIHGFLSNTIGAFGDIGDTSNSVLWCALELMYEDRILGFNHYTISKSPIQNTLELLEALPEESEVDIIAHSRGGIIADLLSRCGGKPSKAFSDKDLSLVSKSDKELLDQLNKLAFKKRIKIKKVIRVGSPVRGTYLLGKRLDVFLNGILTGLGLATGAEANLFYSITKKFLLDTLASRSDTNIFPGIAAMVPNSEFQKMLNSKETVLDNDLYVIEGNAEIGRNVKQSVMVMLTNMYYWTGNDFVVNTNSMRFGSIRAKGANVFLSKDSNTNHFRYFKNGNTQGAILRALAWSSKSTITGFVHFDKETLILEDKQHQNKTRSGEAIESYTNDTNELLVEPVDLIDEMFGPRNKVEEGFDKIRVSVAHGDLKFSDYPVMVGHFKNENILNAEASIDANFDGILEEYFFLGNYPQLPSDNLIVIQKDRKPCGCVIIGLGDRIQFNAYQLRIAVEKGIIAYATSLRDTNHNSEEKINSNAITCLCIGSGYGGLDMESALSSILFGIQNANNKIKELNKLNFERRRGFRYRQLEIINDVQFVELFEDKAEDAFYGLIQIDDSNYKLNLDLPKKISSLYGSQKRKTRQYRSSWWHEMIAESIGQPKDSINDGIRFMSSSGRAKVDLRNEFHSKKFISSLLPEFSKVRSFDKILSNSLFQLLIPNDLKDVLRNQNNIILKVDKNTARFPWEMIHDKDYDKDPTFINTGLIRQLITTERDTNEKITRDRSALIIADPIYTNYDALHAAKEEGKLLKQKLQEEDGWDIKHIENGSYYENATALLNYKFKLLHIAGHGVYNEKTGEAGIVMEDTLIDSVFLGKMPHIPEIAFINCCYTGTVNSSLEDLYKGRYEIAASIGVKLIEMGVNAVIITGWAVGDDAAKDFADRFYSEMLKGEQFGKAVQVARKYIFDKHKQDNTWGAYQCYGDPWYKLNKLDSRRSSREYYLSENEVLIELYNIKSSIIDKKDSVEIIAELNFISSKIKNTKFENASVMEKMAEIYIEIDELELAIETYSEMLKKESATYTLRAVEQYRNILVKHTLNAKTTAESKKMLIDNFEDLIKLSPTSERYSLLGSLYKRLAQFSPKQPNKDRYLQKMVDNYWNAYRMLNPGSDYGYIYSITCALQGEYLLNPVIKSVTIEKGRKPFDILKKLKTLIKTLKNTPKSKNDFWADINLINVYTTLILFNPSSSGKKLEEITTAIMSRYEHEFISSGTAKNIRSEVEHFEFLSNSVSDEEKKRAIDKVLIKLKKLKTN